MDKPICIATWLVLDDARDSTSFPSAGSSAIPSVQMTYWRCVGIYYLTSAVHNPGARHVFFSNVDVRARGPADVVSLLQAVGVEFVHLDITHRLPRGSVKAWGNQFYVLDVIRNFVEARDEAMLVLTDSDCVWRKSAETFLADIERHGSLLYTLQPQDQKNYEVGNLINGLSHARMKAIADEVFDARIESLPRYQGGEFLAATRACCASMAKRFDALWTRAVAEAHLVDSIKEEAHFLSIIAEIEKIPPGTANHVVRRMWTHYEDYNIVPGDLELAIWHLPAEKKYGFARMWRHVVSDGRRPIDWRPDEIDRMTASYMGVPRRDVTKVVQDIAAKAIERVGTVRHRLLRRRVGAS